MYNKIANLVVDHAKWILLASLVLAVVCAFNLPKLGFDFTPQQLFRSTSDAADFREEFAERFGREDNLVFVVVEADDIYRPDIVQFTRDLTVELRETDRVEAADSLATMELPRPSDGMLATTPIVPGTGEVTREDAEALRELAQSEPLVQGQMVASSGKLTAVLIWIDPNIQEITELDSALNDFQAAMDAVTIPDGVTTSLGGVPFLRTRIVDELRHQQMTFIPGTALIYFLVLLLLFRRPVGVFAPLGVVAIAVLLTVSLMVATDSSINIINNILPTLIFIICISDSIHMLVRDAEETEAGLDRRESVKAMIRHTGAACLLTSTTTAVGFFSLVAADTEILQNFGWQAGAGVMFGYLVTLLFLPAAAVLLRPVDRSTASGLTSGDQPKLERWLSILGHKVLDHPKKSIVGGLLIAVIAAAFGAKVEINTVLLEVFEPGHPAYDSTMRIEEELSGVLPVEIALDGTEPDAFKDPALFAKMRAVQQFAEKDPIVLSSQSLVDFHQAARAAVMGDPRERAVLPESREQIEQLHLLIAGSPDSKTGPNRFVTTDFKHARILLRVSDAGAIEQLRLGNELETMLDEQFDGTGIDVRITGDAYVASAALTSFIRDLFVSLLLAMIIIFGMMTVVFRSITIGFISMLPNMIPLVLTFGYMGAAGIDLNTTTVIIFAISLGLAVDDTIHFLARFREELEAHPNDVRQAVLGAYNGAGRAILITSVMLLVGLVVLLFSSFVPAQYFARLTAITIAGALLGDLLILPPILYLVYQWKQRRAES